MNLQDKIRKILHEELDKPKFEKNRDEFITKVKDNIFVTDSPDSYILNYATFGPSEKIISFNKKTRNIKLLNSRFKKKLELLFPNNEDKIYIIKKLFTSIVTSLKKIEKFDLQEDTMSSPKLKLEQLIERQSLREVVKMMGVDKVSTILETTPLQLIRDFFLDKTFSIDDFNINTGGYDFSFEIIDIDEEGDDVWYVYAKIGDGTVMLMTDEDNEQRDLWNSGLWDEDYWWEIQGEIMEIIYDILLPFEPKYTQISVEHNLM
jgi:hypothetical protein